MHLSSLYPKASNVGETCGLIPSTVIAFRHGLSHKMKLLYSVALNVSSIMQSERNRHKLSAVRFLIQKYAANVEKQMTFGVSFSRYMSSSNGAR
jgi:hypothetical protein